MTPPPMVTPRQERRVLEKCISECKRRIDQFRAEGLSLQEALAEKDLNRMLEELQTLIQRGAKR